MGRRYLTLDEAESALNRGKSIESFLGSCSREDERGIKWLSVRKNANIIKVSVFESADLGDESHIDIYEFGPLNQDLEFEDADEEIVFSDFSTFTKEIENRFPGVTSKLVNEFIVQDEYVDFVKAGRK